MRRFRGWEPRRTTTVTEWDEQGRPAKWVTEVEAEFDLIERDGWHALEEYESEICGKCGNLRCDCRDPLRPWYPQGDVCYASADLAVHHRRFAKKHEKAHPDPQGRLPGDGLSLWVAAEDLTPGEEPY